MATFIHTPCRLGKRWVCVYRTWGLRSLCFLPVSIVIALQMYKGIFQVEFMLILHFIIFKPFDDLCREHVGDWDEDDFPHTEHRALFPHCPFVRGLDVGNVTTNAEIRERSGVVASRSSNEQSMQNGRGDCGCF